MTPPRYFGWLATSPIEPPVHPAEADDERLPERGPQLEERVAIGDLADDRPHVVRLAALAGDERKDERGLALRIVARRGARRPLGVVRGQIRQEAADRFDNNAFYAVNEKVKSASKNYQPTLTVKTKRQNGQVEIQVMDNGRGIPENIRDKIFQPFFTTKPTGQGTGLGLSLGYDIIKAHGGELKVVSQDGEGTTFTIQIPA